MTKSAITVAMAILYRENKFLMQLRDDVPGIAHPGLWGFFGGKIEPGETPFEGVQRELIEEIDYETSDLTLFYHSVEKTVIRNIFYGPLTVGLDQLNLMEGWDLGLITPEQIQTGEAYSEVAGMSRRLGQYHQEILLNFLEFAQAHSMTI